MCLKTAGRVAKGVDTDQMRYSVAPDLLLHCFFRPVCSNTWGIYSRYLTSGVVTCGDLFVLRFYGLINPIGSCRVQSVYLTKLFLNDQFS